MKLKKIKSKSEISQSDSPEGYLIESSESEARRIIDSLKGTNKIIAFKPSDNKAIRRAIETLKINYLVSPESGDKKDSLKQRDSGLNHVLAKEAAKKGIKLVIDFDEISGLNPKQKALRIEKLIQNVSVCRKANCEIRIWGSSDKASLRSFCTNLGMDSHQSKKAVD